jgi:outer membrane protein assembly factor BamB
MRTRGLILGLILVTSSSMSAAAADWPRFRGPNGAGVDPAANVPAKFTDKDFNWKVALPGFGHSSPVVVGNKVFVTCGDKETSQRYAIAVDLDTGKVLWQREYPFKAIKQHGYNSYASATPTADAEHVYFTFIGGDVYRVYCLDHAGKDVWTYDVGPWVSTHGCGVSPTIVDDLLIVPNDQDGPTASIVALDKKTGSVRWQIPRKFQKNGAAASTPCVFQPKGGAAQLILTSRTDGMSGHDPKTGKTLWSLPDVISFRPVGSPIATDTLVIGTSGEGGDNRTGTAVEPPSAPGGQPKIVFKTPTGKSYPYVPSPVVKGDLLFTWSDIGTVTCTRVSSGEKIWQQPVGQEYFSSPVIAGDKLLNVTKKGAVICLAAGEKFEELGRSDLGDLCYATPAIAGNRLIIRTATGLISVGK